MEALLGGALTSETQEKAQKRVDVMATSAQVLKDGEFSDFQTVLDTDNDGEFAGRGMSDVFGMDADTFQTEMKTALDEGFGNNEEIAELTKDQSRAMGRMLSGLKKSYVESGMGTGADFLTLQENVLKGLGGFEEADASELLGGILDQMHSTAKESKEDIRQNKQFRKNLGVSETAAVSLSEEEKRKIKDVKSASDIDTRAAQAQEDIKAANKQIKASETALEDVEKEKAAAKEEKAKREAETKAKFQDAAPGADDGIAATNVEANTDAAATSLASLDKQASSVGSLYTHDIHCEVLLQAILAELQGKDSEAALKAGLKRNEGMAAQESQESVVDKVSGTLKASFGANASKNTGGSLRDKIGQIAASISKEDMAGVTEVQKAALKGVLGGGSISDLSKESIVKGGQDALNKMASLSSGNSTFDATLATYMNPKAGIDAREARIDRAEGGGEQGRQISTDNLNDTIAKFSMSTEELAGVMGNALTIEVGGTIDVNVNMNGAEFLNGAKDSLGKYASQQVTKGINNFITQGLKNNNVKTKPDWVNEGGTNGIPGSSNNESGSM